MKKTLCMLLAILLLASLGAAAFADSYTEDYKENGLTLTYTEEFDKDNLKGVFLAYPHGRVDDGIFDLAFLYYALSEPEFNAMMSKTDAELTDADKEAMRTKLGTLTVVYALDPEEMSAENAAILEGTMDGLEELAKVGNLTFYRYRAEEAEETEAFLAGIAPAYQEEYLKLQAALTEVLKNAEYYAPVIPGEELIGTALRFETTDVDGNPVRSEDIFKDHELTMINVWATWCHNCVDEMAGLAEMNHRLAEKNAAVIGICTDADTSLDECKEIIKEKGVDYLNLLPSEDLAELLNVSGLPTSYFVDSEGRILSLPVKGAPPEMSYYEDIIDKLLSGEKVKVDSGSNVRASDSGVYRVIVGDEEGNLVKGATVQFCSDTTCTMGKTDENGVAVFNMEEGPIYTIHMLKVPEGYEKTNEEFETADTYCDVYIVLQKAA